jgi:hypothetical protein
MLPAAWNLWQGSKPQLLSMLSLLLLRLPKLMCVIFFC